MQAFELAAIARMHSEVAEAEDADAGDTPSAKIPGFSHVTEEFADLLIRIFDWCGYRGYDLQGEYLRDSGSTKLKETYPRTYHAEGFKRTLAYCHYALGMATEDVRNGGSPVAWFGRIVSKVNAYHQYLTSESLDAAVQAKMEYNKSRPYMHGKLS